YGEYIPMHITKGVKNGNVIALYAKENEGMLKSSTDAGIWMMGVDSDGRMTWEKTIKTDERRRVTELSTYSGGYYIGAIFPSYIWDYFYSDESVFYLTKTDEEGNVLWEKTYPIITSGAIEGMAPALDGEGLIINTAFKLNDYETINTVQYIDPDGVTGWNYSYPSKSYEYNTSGIEPVQGKGYIITDYVEGTHSFIRLDENGEELWIVEGRDLAGGIVSQPEYFYAHDQYQEKGDPIWNLRLRKFDYDGSLVDEKRYTDFTAAGAVYDFNRPDGGFVIFEPIGGQYIELGRDLDQLIFSSIYEDQGKDISEDYLDYVDASPMDQLNYVRVIYDWDNEYYYLSAIPYTYSQIQSQINEEPFDFASTQISVYPNPVDSYLWITGEEIRPEEVQLRDLSGRVHNINISRESDRLRLDMSGLASGIYLITVETSEDSRSYRIIKN
ncbi:MAG: T9SS type A sorting domain-containing protein, partial [Cyclobacteriaceae bacterium]